jgi:hypothetical protein
MVPTIQTLNGELGYMRKGDEELRYGPDLAQYGWKGRLLSPVAWTAASAGSRW